jgi:hypothetical protein
MPYIFRLETSRKAEQLSEAGRKALFQEMKRGRLRQGWGRDGMGLLDEHGKALSRDAWVKNYLVAAKDWGPE